MLKLNPLLDAEFAAFFTIVGRLRKHPAHSAKALNVERSKRLDGHYGIL
jgi:hypothetical protein